MTAATERAVPAGSVQPATGAAVRPRLTDGHRGEQSGRLAECSRFPVNRRADLPESNRDTRKGRVR